MAALLIGYARYPGVRRVQHFWCLKGLGVPGRKPLVDRDFRVSALLPAGEPADVSGGGCREFSPEAGDLIVLGCEAGWRCGSKCPEFSEFGVSAVQSFVQVDDLAFESLDLS